LSPPGDFGPPPLPIPLTTSGGVWNTTFPQKTTFPQFFKTTHFFLFDTSSCEADSGKTEMKFKKPKEVFVHHGLKNKKSPIFFAKVPPVGRIEAVFQPHFSDFWFFLLQSRFCGSCFGEVETKFEKLKEVFSPDKIIYNKILQFFHRCHRLGEIND
jgi:hypothetical protein